MALFKKKEKKVKKEVPVVEEVATKELPVEQPAKVVASEYKIEKSNIKKLDRILEKKR